IDEKIEPYMYIDDDGHLTFDYEEAEKEGLGEAYIDVGMLYNKISDANNSSQADNEIALSLPILGNWCGPGHGVGYVQDVLDLCCKNHDLCYGARGYFDCICDRDIVNYIEANYKYMRKTEKKVAAAIRYYFIKAPCNPF